MTKWQEVKLGDICLFIDYRGKTPHKIKSGIPLITAKIVKNGRIYDPTEFISEEEYQSRMTRGIPNCGDILITTEAPLGEVAELKDEHVAIGQRLITMRGYKDILQNKYLKYYLQSKEGQSKLKARETGTTVTGIKSAELKQVLIPLPPLETQKKIASVSGVLDDKIELNNRINNNLEQQAQALFKSWFIDFEPFGGKMPEDWKTCKLGECTKDVIRGFTSKYVEKSNLINLNQKVNKGRSLEKQYYKYLDESVLVPKEKYAKKGDVLLNSLGQGTLGRLHYWNENCDNVVIDQHITIIRADNSNSVSEYLYLLLDSQKYKDYFDTCITGTTGMLMLNISAVRNTDVMLPNIVIQREFAQIVNTLYSIIEHNNTENERLSQLRDTLLPKLMSGEIDVSKVDISKEICADKSSFRED